MKNSKQISILGAGRSAGYLIEYLSAFCDTSAWNLVVYGQDFNRLISSFKVSPSTILEVVNLSEPDILENIVNASYLVVSVLPPAMHIRVAEYCLKCNTHLFTASYTSDAMMALGPQAKQKGLLFMNELGLDPGIDHLSASKLFDKAKALELSIESFESHCGGLVLEADCQNNPWKYKFTWNPTNVVLAGQGGNCVWKQGNLVKTLDGMEVFANAWVIEIPGLGSFDVYANRNSLTYESLYGLNQAKTLLRGTLRRRHYCAAWDMLVKAGFTESKAVFAADDGVKDVRSWFKLKTGFDSTADWIDHLKNNALHPLAVDLTKNAGFQNINSIVEHVVYLALETAEVPVKGKTSAEILEQILLDKWRLMTGERDEVIMIHRLGLRSVVGQSQQWDSVLKVVGEGGDRTAMAKTVGLPLAIGVETFLMDEASDAGVVIPFDITWYKPILEKLSTMGISFEEYMK